MISASSRSAGETVAVRQAAQMPCSLLLVGLGPSATALVEHAMLDDFACVAVESAAAALELQARDPSSIVVTASRLPDGSGTQLIEGIRACNSATYAYGILVADDDLDVDAGHCAADAIVSARAEELPQALRSARRIVIMEHVCRLEGRNSRDDALVDQVSGRYSAEYFLQTALRQLEQSWPDGQLPLILVRVEPGVPSDALRRRVVSGLFEATRSDADVVAQISPDTFALLLHKVPPDMADRIRTHLSERLAIAAASLTPASPVRIRCGLGVGSAPTADALQQLHMLLAEAEDQLREAAEADLATTRGSAGSSRESIHVHSGTR